MCSLFPQDLSSELILFPFDIKWQLLAVKASPYFVIEQIIEDTKLVSFDVKFIRGD